MVVTPAEGGFWRAVGKGRDAAAQHSLQNSGQTSPPRQIVLPQNVSGAEMENLALKDCLAVAGRVGSQSERSGGREAVAVIR